MLSPAFVLIQQEYIDSARRTHGYGLTAILMVTRSMADGRVVFIQHERNILSHV